MRPALKLSAEDAAGRYPCAILAWSRTHMGPGSYWRGTSRLAETLWTWQLARCLEPTQRHLDATQGLGVLLFPDVAVTSLLGDLGQASSLLCTRFSLRNCGNDAGPLCYRVLLHPEDKHSLGAGYCCVEQQLAAVASVH